MASLSKEVPGDSPFLLHFLLPNAPSNLLRVARASSSHHPDRPLLPYLFLSKKHITHSFLTVRHGQDTSNDSAVKPTSH